MIDDDFDPYDVVVTRRIQPQPPAFDCLLCEKTIRPGPWPYQQEYDRPPICGRCLGQWADYRRRWSNITRGDHHVLRQLSAAINRLNWETYNGRRRA